MSDPRALPPIEGKTLSIAFLVGLAHLIGGVAVMVAPSALLVTPFAALHQMTMMAGFSNGFSGLLMIGAGVMAIVGASRGTLMKTPLRIVMMTPQQALLLLQLWSITVALVEGRYPDGYVPAGGAWFILTDQAWAWILAVSHSVWLAAFIYGGAVRGRYS